MKTKSNKTEHKLHIEECCEYILEERSGWTQFTRWAREKYGINNRYANELWNQCWDELSKQQDKRIQHTIDKTLMELEQVKEAAILDNDRRIWLETIKYQNKIRGGEIERQEIKIQGEVKLSWGDTLQDNER
jgi:hypothetical protein